MNEEPGNTDCGITDQDVKTLLHLAIFVRRIAITIYF